VRRFAKSLLAVVLAVATPLVAQDFVPTNAPPTPVFASTLDFTGNVGVFSVADGVLRRAGGPAPLAGIVVPATAPTGRVHALVQLPVGTIVVGCERGLFVCDAEHAVLDPADLRDGAPRGEVRSVVADSAGRVWWCSEQDLGVVDLRLRFGRTFTAADGVPPGPLRRVALAPIDGDTRLVVETESGAFAYRIDAGPPPRATAPLPAVVAANSAGEATLPISVAARGGGTLRVRRRHHHLVVPLDGQVVRGLRPGRHGLEVWAFDRDLRSTVLGECTVEVPLPPQFDTRLVPVLLAAFVMVLFAVAWRTGGAGSVGARFGRAAARTGVLTIVLLQAAAAIAGYGRSWPFVGFTMYTETWHHDDVLFRPRIVGLRSDGTRVPLHENEVGVVQDGYWQMLAEVAFGDERHRRELLQRVALRAGNGAPFVGFVLADGRIRLTADGPVDVAPTVLLEHRAR
jgi:hypothetical protein